MSLFIRCYAAALPFSQYLNQCLPVRFALFGNAVELLLNYDNRLLQTRSVAVVAGLYLRDDIYTPKPDT